MTIKITRKMVGLYSFLVTFLVSLLTIFSYFYATNQKNWFLEIVQKQFMYLPLIATIFVTSLIVALTIYLLISIMEKYKFGFIEEKLRLLSLGNYEHKALEKRNITTGDDIYVLEIEKDVSLIHKKMIEMSTELQQLNSRPQIVDGMTKEEILEMERQRLARELHDSVSQQLFAAAMMISALTEQLTDEEISDESKQQLSIVGNIIDASQSEMRALLLHLRPINLEGKSLKEGIEQLLNELQTKIKIKLKWSIEDVQLNSSIEDNLFRIIQELLSNTLRHAKATELELYLQEIENNVLLRVLDDGIGFDAEEQENKAGSYGLKNIKERVLGMGGNVKLISFKNKGTSIEIKVPIIKETTHD